jgi:hypothetical protein
MTNPKMYGKKQASIWFTYDEYTAVAKKAASLGMKFSEYVRFVCLNTETRVGIKKLKKNS